MGTSATRVAIGKTTTSVGVKDPRITRPKSNNIVARNRLSLSVGDRVRVDLDIVVLGHLYFEIYVPPDVDIPEAGQEIFSDSFSYEVGGVLNTSTVLSALGLSTGVIYPATKSFLSAAIASVVDEHKLVSFPFDSKSISTSIVFRKKADRGFLTSADFAGFKNLDTVPDCRIVHVAGLKEAYAAKNFLHECRKRGILVSVSGSYCPAELEMLAGEKDFCDFLFLNETEAIMAFKDVSVARMKGAQIAKQFFITLGRKGVWAVINSLEYEATPKTIKPIDATGAGDAFVGGYLAGQLRGLNVEKSIQLAHKAAAIVLQQVSGVIKEPNKMEKLKNEYFA